MKNLTKESVGEALKDVLIRLLAAFIVLPIVFIISVLVTLFKKDLYSKKGGKDA